MDILSHTDGAHMLFIHATTHNLNDSQQEKK